MERAFPSLSHFTVNTEGELENTGPGDWSPVSSAQSHPLSLNINDGAYTVEWELKFDSPNTGSS